MVQIHFGSLKMALKSQLFLDGQKMTYLFLWIQKYKNLSYKPFGSKNLFGFPVWFFTSQINLDIIDVTDTSGDIVQMFNIFKWLPIDLHP